MKIANPERTLGAVMAEQGKRPHGWYEMETLTAVVKGMYPDWVRIDALDDAARHRMHNELLAAEQYPWRYEGKHEGEMFLVRAVQQRSRVTETQPAQLGSRRWETDPEAYFQGPPIPNVDYLEGGRHDPNLGSEPRWQDEL
jgi:hypothetical protein